MKKVLSVFAALLVVSLLVNPASAGVVILPGLVNTGVDLDILGGSDPLAGDVGDKDLSYSLTGPSGVNAAYWVKRPNAWVAEPSDAHWIGPDLSVQGGGSPQGGLDNDPVGLYTYTLKFDVALAYVPYLQITGRWATDNGAVMKINGNAVATTANAEFGSLKNFVIGSGFVAGENFLTFEVNNASGSGNPSGLIVSGLTATVPEPMSVAVWTVLAIVGLGIARRRRRS